MRLESLKYPDDIEQAANLSGGFSSGKGLADDQADPMLQSAMERPFIIVGEALRRLLAVEPEVASLITGHRQIIDFRNILVHGYDIIRDERVWDIVENRLALLVGEVVKLRERGDAEHPPDS